MRAWTSILGLLLVGLVVAGRPPAAEAGGKHGKPPLDAILERHAERLGLDAETLARIRAVAETSRPEHERLADALHALRSELREQLAQDEPDRDAVMRLADQVGAAETALDKHRLATLLDIRALLTPEQRRELVRVFEERRKARHEAKRRAEEGGDVR